MEMVVVSATCVPRTHARPTEAPPGGLFITHARTHRERGERVEGVGGQNPSGLVL